MEKRLDAFGRIDRGEPSLVWNVNSVGLEENRKNIDDFCFKMIIKDSLDNQSKDEGEHGVVEILKLSIVKPVIYIVAQS